MGAIRRLMQQRCLRRFDRLRSVLYVVAAEIVHEDDIFALVVDIHPHVGEFVVRDFRIAVRLLGSITI